MQVLMQVPSGHKYFGGKHQVHVFREVKHY